MTRNRQEHQVGFDDPLKYSIPRPIQEKGRGGVKGVCSKQTRSERGSGLHFPASSRSLSRPAFSMLPIRSFPTGGPALGTCVEPGFGSQRTITGKRGKHAV